MWVLLAVVLKVNDLGMNVPVYDKPIINKTLSECNENMKKIHDEYKILKANYPVEVEFKINDNKQKYLKYTYKPDYTKPNIVTYYHCLKVYKKNENL